MKTSIWLPKRAGVREHDPVRSLDYVWRPTAAHSVLSWMHRHLRHVKGPNAGKLVVWSPWQIEYFSALYGWRVHGHEEWGRYRLAYLEISRFNGKTTMVASSAVKRLFGRKGVLVIGVAADREQANIVFGDAAAMVRADRGLSDAIDITDSTRRMRRIGDHGGRYLVLSSEDHRAHGFHPDLIVFDELHTQRDAGLWDVLSTAQTGLPDATLFSITTAGDDRESICWKVHERAVTTCNDRESDLSLLASIYAAEEGDDIEDRAVMLKANPNLGVSVIESELRRLVNAGKRDPMILRTVMQLNFNVWQHPEVRPIRLEDWDACGAIVDETVLMGRDCYGGLDIADIADLTALALQFPNPDGTHDVVMRFWAPEATIARNYVYQSYVARGLITPTPGRVTRRDLIKEEILRLDKKFRIVQLAYDPWGAHELAQDLEGEGVRMKEHRQGYASMGEPTKKTLSLILDHQLRHGGHGVLRWNADNLVVTKDAPGNLKPDRSKASGKIDGMVALIMAVGAGMDAETPPEIYVVSA